MWAVINFALAVFATVCAVSMTMGFAWFVLLAFAGGRMTALHWVMWVGLEAVLFIAALAATVGASRFWELALKGNLG
jgi:hypothetical protein